MPSRVRPEIAESTAQGLAFLAMLAFVISFFVVRVFTSINPDVVVVSLGIRFHHFWYGLVMVIGAGWLGIASTRPEYDRAYAVIFGLGLGLTGDEAGLLLTLGDYHSELTYVVFVLGLSGAVLLLHVVRHRTKIGNEVFRLGKGERAVHLGMGTAAISVLPLASGHATTGVVILLAGLLVILAGIWLHRRRGRCGA